jgi:hypothetical protein
MLWLLNTKIEALLSSYKNKIGKKIFDCYDRYKFESRYSDGQAY